MFLYYPFLPTSKTKRERKKRIDSTKGDILLIIFISEIQNCMLFVLPYFLCFVEKVDIGFSLRSYLRK